MTRDHKSRIICSSRSQFASCVQSYIDECKPLKLVRQGGSGNKTLMVLEGDADAYVYPLGGLLNFFQLFPVLCILSISIKLKGTKKWDTCATEAVLLAVGGKLTKPDGTLYDYSSANWDSFDNEEGFIATVFGNKYHESFLEQNLKNPYQSKTVKST